MRRTGYERAMRLRRSDPSAPGLTRVRRGRGFSYVGLDGAVVDPATKERILALVIPPAWTDVWISPHPHGHLQALGTDQAGRRQYLYHEQWRRQRDQLKHERVRALARELPAVRESVERDLRRRGFGKERVVAGALRMLDAGMFRTGGEEYEQTNGSHGVATLLPGHVTVSGDTVRFDFPAKSGQAREAELVDRPLAALVRGLKRGRGDAAHLLQWRDRDGWHDLHGSDLNEGFRRLAGEDYSVKDLRTWAATVTAAAALARVHPPPVGRRERERAEREAIAMVAEHLGNTVSVARASYVDPGVLDAHAVGRTIGAALRRNLSKADLARLERGELAATRGRSALERAVLRLLTTGG